MLVPTPGSDIWAPTAIAGALPTSRRGPGTGPRAGLAFQFYSSNWSERPTPLRGWREHCDDACKSTHLDKGCWRSLAIGTDAGAGSPWISDDRWSEEGERPPQRLARQPKRGVVVAIHPHGASSTLHHDNSDRIYGAGCAKIDLSVSMLETLLPDMPVLILSRCRRAAVNIVEHYINTY